MIDASPRGRLSLGSDRGHNSEKVTARAPGPGASTPECRPCGRGGRSTLAVAAERVEAAQEVELGVHVFVAALAERRPARRAFVGGAATAVVLQAIQRPHRPGGERRTAGTTLAVAVFRID